MPPHNQSGPLRNQIRRLRFEHGELTQQDLAGRAGVTRQTIIALEGGKYTPSLLLAFRLARAFGVSVEAVFQYDGDARATEPDPSV
jgi:putative transcriptional regulator